MKKNLQSILAFLARKIIQKYRPVIIGITGSVGKTSAKEAIYLVVSQKYRARKPEKNFNNELGLPLTVIGSDAPGKNPLAWLGVLLKAAGLIAFRRQYPEALVLEMGVDRPGDMDHLLSIARPHVAVITAIGISHYEFFRDAAAIEEEKGKIAQYLSPEDFLLLNARDEAALRQKGKTRAKVITYGAPGADVFMENVRETLSLPAKTFFDAHTPGQPVSASINAVGESHLLAIAAGIAVGSALRIQPSAIAKGISSYRPAPGRLNFISGIKHSILIDDSYNSAPSSAAAALQVLSGMAQSFKIAVLGDMLELGNLSDRQHEIIGAKAAASGIQKLITVGPQARLISRAAKAAGMDSADVLSFDRAEEAGKFLQGIMPPGCAILIKGSQGMRMEKITKEIMAEPMRAYELLPRQYDKWLAN